MQLQIKEFQRFRPLGIPSGFSTSTNAQFHLDDRKPQKARRAVQEMARGPQIPVDKPPQLVFVFELSDEMTERPIGVALVTPGDASARAHLRKFAFN